MPERDVRAEFPEPFLLLDPSGQRTVHFEVGQNLAGLGASGCLSSAYRTSVEAYTCSVKVPQRWQRNERSH